MNRDYSEELIRGVGYVAIFAAHLEDELKTCHETLCNVTGLNFNERASASQRIKFCTNLLSDLKSPAAKWLCDALQEATRLFNQRNNFLHSLIHSPNSLRENAYHPNSNTFWKADGPGAMALYRELDELRKELKTFQRRHVFDGTELSMGNVVTEIRETRSC